MGGVPRNVPSGECRGGGRYRGFTTGGTESLSGVHHTGRGGVPNVADTLVGRASPGGAESSAGMELPRWTESPVGRIPIAQAKSPSGADCRSDLEAKFGRSSQWGGFTRISTRRSAVPGFSWFSLVLVRQYRDRLRQDSVVDHSVPFKIGVYCDYFHSTVYNQFI